MKMKNSIKILGDDYNIIQVILHLILIGFIFYIPYKMYVEKLMDILTISFIFGVSFLFTGILLWLNNSQKEIGI